MVTWLDKSDRLLGVFQMCVDTLLNLLVGTEADKRTIFPNSDREKFSFIWTRSLVIGKSSNTKSQVNPMENAHREA